MKFLIVAELLQWIPGWRIKLKKKKKWNLWFKILTKCVFSLALIPVNVDLEHCNAAMIQWQGISADSGAGLQALARQCVFYFVFLLLHFNGNDNDSRCVSVTTQPRIISYLYYALMLMWIPTCLSRFACVCVYINIYIYFLHVLHIQCPFPVNGTLYYKQEQISSFH